MDIQIKKQYETDAGGQPVCLTTKEKATELAQEKASNSGFTNPQLVGETSYYYNFSATEPVGVVKEKKETKKVVKVESPKPQLKKITKTYPKPFVAVSKENVVRKSTRK